LRREIRAVQNRLGVTTIMVTHDQEEAQTMADRIFVMNAGRIEQMGSPSEIYDAPASPFVADFIGIMNFLPVEIVDTGHVQCGREVLSCDAASYDAGRSLSLAVRPEDILLEDPAGNDSNCFAAVIQYLEPLGSFVRVYLEAETLAGDEIRVDVRKDLAKELQLTVSKAVTITLPRDDLRLYLTESGM